MKRLENESFEGYKKRRKEAQAETNIALKGNWKKKTVLVDGEEKKVPIIHSGANRKARRYTGSRLFSNKKGIQMVVVPSGKGFTKYRKRVQMELDENGREKMIVHSEEVPQRHSR